MNRVLIGSSNVYRHYKSGTFKDYNKYILVKCVDIKSFEAIMSNLGRPDKEVIVSVLENFLDRAGSLETTQEGYLLTLGRVFDEYQRIIGEAAVRNPASKFSIVDPIWRPKLEWYQGMYDDIITTNREMFVSLRLENVSRSEGIPEGCQQFEPDQVHLTEDSANIFIDGLLKSAEVFFKAPFINLEEEDINMDEAEDEVDLSVRLGKLEGHVRARQTNDNMIFARLREESDAVSNKSKEDRVIITGITSKEMPPTDPELRKVWIKKIAMDIFTTLIPDFGGQIHFVNQAKNKGMHIPLIEVKLDSVENAAKIRKAFSVKKREKVDLGRIFVANSVGLSTRVRVDILKAIAKAISGPSFSAHVVAFISRPVMHVKSPDGTVNPMTPKTYTFVDAVAEFGSRVTQVELAEAYRRAGTAFKGQMEQVFILLREKDEAGYQQQQHQRGHHHRQRPQRGAERGEGRKRQREEDDGHQEEESGTWSNRAKGGRGYYRGKRYQKGKH